MSSFDQRFGPLLREASGRNGPVVFLTGEGLSVESGVSTLRSEDAHWKVGPRRYDPVELATVMAFRRTPADVWAWYLYRRASCRRAEPNAAHRAIARLESHLQERMHLVTEAVDGLHLRAGSSGDRTYQIHGNLNLARCAAECRPDIVSLPKDFAVTWQRDQPLSRADREVLTCPHCGDWLRPNVLWFDETPDEDRFRSDSALRVAGQAALLVVVGSSSAPALPTKMCQNAITRGVLAIVIDREATPLIEMMSGTPTGVPVVGPAADVLPHVCEAVGDCLGHA